MTKKTHRKAIIFLFFIGLTFIACKKKNQEPKVLKLPAITTSGANTFGCKINGEVFVPKGDFNHASIEYPMYYIEDGGLWIRTHNRHDFNKRIHFTLYVPNGIYEEEIYLKHSLDNECDIEYTEYKTIDGIQKTTGSSFYYIDTNINYSMEITRLDLENKIVSALFEFTAINKKSNDTLKITEGRFDLKNLTLEP